MRDSHAPSILANQVSLLRSASRTSAIALVEGDSDVRFFRRFFLPPPACRILPCDGKPNLLDTVEIVGARGVQGVVAICDRDFDDLLGIARGDVIYVDNNDLEMMAIHSGALRHALSELAPRFQDLDTDQVIAVRDECVLLAGHIGRLRLHSHANGLGLNFSALDLTNYVSNDALDLAQLVSDLLAETPGAAVSHADLMGVAHADHADRTPAELASGHDVCAVIAPRCNIGGQQPASAAVEMALRLAFDTSCFQLSRLVRDLLRWEQQTGFEVLDPAAIP